MSIRLAVVQHGDYAEALRVVESGRPEPYQGMTYTVGVLERFLGGHDFLMVNLDAPPYRVPHRNGLLVGAPCPRWPKLSKVGWAWRASREVRAYRPTHLLLRTGGLIGLPLLRYAARRGVGTLVLHAGYMRETTWRERLLHRELARLMNDPAVFLAGNHRVPAAESLIACGVRREKVVAYDLPDQDRPTSWPAKQGPPAGDCRVAYVGNMVASKGVGDLLAAVNALNRAGFATRLTACGDGPELGSLRDKAGRDLGDRAEFPGRLPNARVLEIMADADLVCVPSRRDSSEGLPFVATEALARRTPLIASDHPSLTHLLRDGEGVRFFPSGDSDSLARVIREVMSDPDGYARLSEGTAAAFDRLECKTPFHEPLERWAATWEAPVAGPEAEVRR